MAATSSMTAPSRTELQELRNFRMIQDFHLVWLDGTIDERNNNDHNSITILRQVINTVNTFIDVDECLDFVTANEEKCFMIISEEFSQTIMPIVQDIPQVSCVYIFRKKNVPYKNWAKK